ncbi:hypothetical protein BFJ63_vAg16253 [Fusarium oxysporum f. sp. narcissi]|uniref:Uncharacterized protein n=1 Tax=Fusarium oxysporum f. sp. narcissi TaxID=451672 RepID=A0A4Q2V2P5_FUSOX|nr:hypothetical protein HZ326_24660 [Fusarium oxysporum f. sp. albedinis]KAK2468444.1 hypothetical protein H9L39_20090 [Fusarium oxysporum f. sp. albedinis]RYC80862.1 hypothetical protein BFJ63_vAg16253 [Fusarium oxysporum f. sp. narcissi]
MNSLIWLWLYSLVSAACDVNYAMWFPHFGMTVINDLIPALPQVSVEEFETINEGIDADKIGGGGTYTVPYSSEMTINKPAIWSGNCPKTLLLLGEETTQNTPMPSQQSTLSTSTKENTNTPVTASGTTHDHTTTSTAGTQKTADPINSKPTGQTTDPSHNKTPTPGKTGSKKATGSAGSEPTGHTTDPTRNKTPTLVKTGSKKATGSAGSEPTGTATDVTSQNVDPTIQTSAETHSPTAEPCTCWMGKDSPSLDTTYKEVRETVVNGFCRRFKKKPLTPKNPSSNLGQKDLALIAYVNPNCDIDKYELDEAVCLKYFRVIEKECSDRGGLLEDGCATVWIAKPS